MLQRPTTAQAFGNRFLSLAWKFNKALERTLQGDKHSCLVELQVHSLSFTSSGDLTSGGRYEYWRDFLRTFESKDKENQLDTTESTQADEANRKQHKKHHRYDHKSSTSHIPVSQGKLRISIIIIAITDSKIVNIT